MYNFFKSFLVGKGGRFLFVGVLNTIFGYGIYALFIYIGIQYILANTLSYILGILHSYIWNKYFTFKQTHRNLLEFIRFVSVYLLSYASSCLLLWLFVGKMGMSAYIAGVLSLFITTVISYVGHNFFSFQTQSDANKQSVK